MTDRIIPYSVVLGCVCQISDALQGVSIATALRLVEIELNEVSVMPNRCFFCTRRYAIIEKEIPLCEVCHVQWRNKLCNIKRKKPDFVTPHVVRQSYIEGLSLADICDKFAISKSTAYKYTLSIRKEQSSFQKYAQRADIKDRTKKAKELSMLLYSVEEIAHITGLDTVHIRNILKK